MSAAQLFFTIIERFHWQFITVPGIKTRKGKRGNSTIDLTFALEDIATQIIHWKIDAGLDCDSDHLSVVTTIDWS